MMTKSKEKPLTIYILSGATGRTAKQVVASALAQFDDPKVRIVKKTNVRSARAAVEIVREAAEKRAVIFHSLVKPKVRDVVLEQAKKQMIPTVDILGRVLAVLGDHLGTSPHREPGLSYKHQKDYFDRVDAVSFTLEHDDGSGLSSLDKADVVLVGVSRVSKSVTCFYLAYRGIRAANVPFIPGILPPDQLLELPRKKVIGLTVNPSRLKGVREARRHAMGHKKPLENYSGGREINEELRFALGLMKKHKWQSIDVSYMAIEEVARHVLNMLGK